MISVFCNLSFPFHPLLLINQFGFNALLLTVKLDEMEISFPAVKPCQFHSWLQLGVFKEYYVGQCNLSLTHMGQPCLVLRTQTTFYIVHKCHRKIQPLSAVTKNKFTTCIVWMDKGWLLAYTELLSPSLLYGMFCNTVSFIYPCFLTQGISRALNPEPVDFKKLVKTAWRNALFQYWEWTHS